jgi:hypothetical protein
MGRVEVVDSLQLGIQIGVEPIVQLYTLGADVQSSRRVTRVAGKSFVSLVDAVLATPCEPILLFGVVETLAQTLDTHFQVLLF